MDAYIESMLPDWANGLAHGQWVLGAQLCTKDGRRIGNAHIIKIEDDFVDDGPTFQVYTILTDAGNTARMVELELAACFHKPRWTSDVAGVIRDFWRQPGSPLTS
jgi:hypothetical protein